MAIVALIIAVVLIAAAVRNTQGILFSALSEDVPAFMVWAAAIFAVGAIGFVPGLKPVSRGLLALVLLVIIMNNYQTIIAGFTQPLGSASANSPASSGVGNLPGLNLPGIGSGAPSSPTGSSSDLFPSLAGMTDLHSIYDSSTPFGTFNVPFGGGT